MIRRFSEDIDIDIYKTDLHVPLEAEIAEQVDEAARQYISGPLREMLVKEIEEVETSIGKKEVWTKSWTKRRYFYVDIL